MKRLRIAIVNLTGGGMSGGYKKYLYNVIPRMAVHSEVEAILCASPYTLNVKGWFGSIPNVEFIGCKPLRLISHKIDSELKIHLEKFSPDVIFIPTERCFNFNKIPVVNMVQNMEPFAGINEGNPISERVKNWFRAYHARRAIKKADKVIAISKFVKEFLIKKWNISENKIGLVCHGIDGSRNCDTIKPPNIPIDWEGKFIFTAGSIRPARGIEDILWAMHYLSNEDKAFMRLVIAGDTSSNMVAYQNKLKGWVEKQELSDRICWAGNLNDEEMSWCFHNCNLFIMTSRIEACPNIAIEAMSYGTVSIAADNPPMPEFFSDCAAYYQSGNGHSLAEVICESVALGSGRRSAISELSQKRSLMFSWDITAQNTISVLKQVIKDTDNQGECSK